MVRFERTMDCESTPGFKPGAIGHSATSPKWYREVDLNHRPRAYQARALNQLSYPGTKWHGAQGGDPQPSGVETVALNPFELAPYLDIGCRAWT